MSKKKAISPSEIASSPIPEDLKKKGGDWNKSKVILWFAKQNKDMKAKEAVVELGKLGVTVKANIYSQTLSNARKKGTITKGGKSKATPKAATGGSNLIQSAAAFIRAAGGIAAAKATLDELEVIGKL